MDKLSLSSFFFFFSFLFLPLLILYTWIGKDRKELVEVSILGQIKCQNIKKIYIKKQKEKRKEKYPG